MSLDESLKCPKCFSSDIKFITGFRVCSNCGECLESENINFSGRRAYTSDEVRDRIFSEPVLRSYGCRTVFNNTEIRNPSICKVKDPKAKFAKLLKLQTNNINSLENKLSRASHYFARLNDYFPSHVLLDAWKIYSHFSKKNIPEFKSLSGLVSACVYVSARVNNYPFFLNELVGNVLGDPSLLDNSMISSERDYEDYSLINSSRIANPSIKNLFRYYSMIVKNNILDELGYRINKQVLPYDRIYDSLSLTNLQAFKIDYISSKIPKIINVSGKRYEGYVAGIVYDVLNRENCHKSQELIGSKLGVNHGTLRTRWKEVKKLIPLILSELPGNFF